MEERTGRSHLTAFISKDDGATWEGGLLLDERGGISYPDGQQAKDGTIYITYDYSRTRHRAIYVATFTEADALAGEDVSGKVRLRMEVTNPGEQTEDPSAPYTPAEFQLRDNRDGVALDRSSIAILRPDHVDNVVDRLEVGKLIWHNRNYVFSVLPEELKGLSFFRTMIRQDSVRGVVEKDGMVYVLAHRAANTDQLRERGFVKTTIPDFIPYTVDGVYKPSDAFTVYQKHVKKGEVVEADQWGIPVFAVE